MASENFDGNTLRKAQNHLRKDQTGLFRDSQSPGLALRVYKTRASWMMILRDGKWTIAPFEMFTAEDIPALRQLVVEARQLVKEGREPQELFDAFREQRDVELAKNKAAVVHGIGKTWEEVRDAYLSWASEHKEPDTVRGYKSALGATKGSVLEKDFEPLHGKPVASITTKDLVRVRNNIVVRGVGEKIRQANLTVASLKACFGWYVNQPDSVLEKSPASELSKALERVKKVKKSADEERTFTQDEIGLLIYGMEFSKNPAARLSLMLQLFTGQRRLTPLTAKKTDFISTEAYEMLWRLDDKVDAWRVLPLPETARLAVENAIALSRSDNDFVFPQQRVFRNGGTADGHMNERTVSAVLEDLRAKGGVLEALPFTPSTHDLRRAFITTMTTKMGNFSVDGVQMRPEDVDRITHRNEGRSSTASAVYDKNAYLDAKLQILEFWEQWCLEGYHRVKEKMEKNAKNAT
ncbi:tyrosine-type recombinase/integrase [Pseudochrobactrum asaccharolyticum]|uniref:tyrosine-type recombinase/integrase n=1 Tax=Pseudochrobactrum asaccharolyticum TaxID=354351 RepID=UPI004043372B